MKLKNIVSFLIIICCLQTSYAKTPTNQYEALTSIVMKAENFIENNYLESTYPPIIQIKPISKRMKLAQCHEGLSIQFNNNSKQFGNTLLKINCKGPVHWSMKLPVKITLFQDVLVLKNAVIKSQSIDVNDIIVKKVDRKELVRGYFSHVSQLKRLQTKRNLTAGTILSPSNLKAKQLVKTGQQVTIFYSAFGMGIKATGTALNSASKGQLIKVRNNSSSKVIEGIVASEGVVKAHL
ncbi:MAG: flagellar basal body P-ring formation protein FlgA [Gammaproteobacteria bacterium]|nr:flagellar basal body P-ring formation protein FlgA [Gammaproteobacteria bacterium]